MATNFSKKTVQNAGIVKKSKFDLTHDFSTSFNWGEVQPLMCRLLPTATSNTLKLNTLVRLSAMNVPTFGRVAFKQSWHFVPMADLFPSYKNVLSGVPSPNVNSSGESVLQTLKFPTIAQDTLMYMLLFGNEGNCMFDRYTRAGTNDTDAEWNYTVGNFGYNGVRKIFPNAPATEGNIVKLDAINHQSRSYLLNTLGYSSEGMNELIYPTGSDFNIFFNDTNTDYLTCIRLSSKGRRLYKILLSLGYQVDFTSGLQVNMLPLLAFYKAYFDAYSLPQYDNWEMTPCAKLIKYWYQTGSESYTLTFGVNVHSLVLLRQFFEDLSACWYTENMDYVSAHLSSNGILPSATGQSEDQLKFIVDGTQTNASAQFDSITGSIHVNGFKLPSDRALDQVSDEILKKMYISINRDSAIGYNIKDRLIARGYKTFVEECKSNFIKGSTIPIQISDVNSLADTTTSVEGEGQPLGAYAGKGIQYDESNSFTYQNSEIGYLVGIGCIIPVNTGYPFSLDPTLLGINRYTFYNPEYDSLSYEQTPKACVGHTKSYYVSTDSVDSEDKVFGLIPRYSGYKIANNRLSGCFAFNSERKSWMPYTLDRDIIENNDAEFTPNGSISTKFTWTAKSNGISHIPVAGKEWRYPTNNSWKGNYNRIFYNEGMQDDGNPISPFFTHSSDETYLPTSDNFLFHSEILHDQWANMLPIAESFDTIDDEKDAPTLDIKD